LEGAAGESQMPGPARALTEYNSVSFDAGDAGQAEFKALMNYSMTPMHNYNKVFLLCKVLYWHGT